MDDTRVPTSRLGRLLQGPQGFRRLLEKRGPIFVKIGQFLALRPDLIARDYCAELMYLFDEVPPFSWHEARAIFREDLGAEPGELFAAVDAKPVAAGSLAQTYVFRLKDGPRVAVKVQRPDIRARVMRDLQRARMLARLLQMSGISLVVSPRDAVEEIANWLLQEIDFTRELANMNRLYRLTARSSYQVVPRPYPEFSSARIITADYLKGMPVSRLLRTCGSDKERGSRSAVDRDEFAENLLTACLTQIFVYQFFHADLHPGNLFVLPSNKIGFVDFGLCDSLDETVRAEQMRYLSAVYHGDTEQTYRALTEILIPSDRADYDGFHQAFLAEARTWSVRRQEDWDTNSRSADKAYGSPVAQYMVGVIRAARQHGFVIPSGVLSLYRALLTAESVAHQIGSTIDLRLVGRHFFAGLQSQEMWRALDLQNLEPVLLSYVALLRDAPSQLHQILSAIADDRFTLRVKVMEQADTTRARNRRTRLITSAILTIGLSVILAGRPLPQLFGLSLTWPVFALLVALYILIFFEWRLLR